MAFSNGLDPEVGLEREEEKFDPNKKLAEDVYGAGAISGEIGRFSSWGLKLRNWVGKFGAEEGGIERIPPEIRTNQHPRGMELKKPC